MAKQNNKLNKQIRKAGSEISGKELQKIGENTGASALKIAQQAANIYAGKAGTTPTFTKGAAKQLTRQARQTLVSDEGYTASSLSGSGADLLSSAFSRIQTQDRLRQLGITPQFAANVAELGRPGKGQALSIGGRGTGSIVPRRGEFKLPKRSKATGETGTPTYEDQLAAMMGESFGAMGDLYGQMSASDTAYMDMLAGQQSQMQDAMMQAIAGLSQPTQAPTINLPATPQIPEPVVLSSPGNNYNISGIRAVSRSPIRRTDYLRDMAINPLVSTPLVSQPIGGVTV